MPQQHRDIEVEQPRNATPQTRAFSQADYMKIIAVGQRAELNVKHILCIFF